MKKIKYVAGFWLFLYLLVSIVSCTKDDELLKEDPKTFYTVDNAFSTSIQIDQVVVGIYSFVRDIYTDVNGFRFLGNDIYDENTAGGSRHNYGVVGPTDTKFFNWYSDYYTIISRANLALYAAELPQITWASPAEKAYVIAQTRFFRGWAFRNLAELWGGVPIVKENLIVPKFDYKRATRIETYQFAIADMEAAEPDLPETTSLGGRLVKGAAQHNLCELYLAMGIQLAQDGKTGEASAAYTKSISYANKVIDGGTYSLINSRFGSRKNETSITFNIYKDGNINAPVDTLVQQTNYFWDLFQENNINYQDGNKESIWTVQIDYAAYKAEDSKSVLQYTRNFGNAIRDNTLGFMIGFLEDAGGRGVRNKIPLFYTRDEVYQDKWAQDMRNSEVVLRRRFKGNKSTSSYYRKIVPWDYIYYGSPDPSANFINQLYSYPLSCKIATDRYTGLADGQNRSNLFRDDYIIRLPETILLRAEAKQRSGDKAGAAADLNLLRTRAKCTYMVTAADMDDKFDMILDERVRELVYEECRSNTLLRMGGTIAIDRIRKYTIYKENKATMTFDYNLWPIPQTVIDANTGEKMEQNPGWTNR